MQIHKHTWERILNLQIPRGHRGKLFDEVSKLQKGGRKRKTKRKKCKNLKKTKKNLKKTKKNKKKNNKKSKKQRKL